MTDALMLNSIASLSSPTRKIRSGSSEVRLMLLINLVMSSDDMLLQLGSLKSVVGETLYVDLCFLFNAAPFDDKGKESGRASK